MKQYQLINGNSAAELKKFPDNHFDSIVTDPPYGINFLGKEWDKDTGEEEVYRECYRVLKPGGHLLAFSAARTYHHLAMAVERSGFEIRDQIMWVYGSGFPKSQDVGRQIQKSIGVEETKTIKTHDIKASGLLEKRGNVEMEQVVVTDAAAKQWSGWGSALKPAHEPIVMARKPFDGPIYKNVQKWGVGAINVDGCRVGDDIIITRGGWSESHDWSSRTTYNQINEKHQGRFPANFIHDGSDEVVSLFPHSGPAKAGEPKQYKCNSRGYREGYVNTDSKAKPVETTNYNDAGSAARFFYHAKVSKTERGADNNHPTVKPVELMKYLVKLVTPQGGHVLDPFNGSGSTGMACVELGYQYTGIDLDADYIKIATARIDAWYEHTHPAEFSNPLFTIDDK